MRARNPRQLVITSDLDFTSILTNPRGRVDAILVPEPKGVSALDAVNRTWPAMWSGQVPWTHEMADFGAFRLYAVEPSAP